MIFQKKKTHSFLKKEKRNPQGLQCLCFGSSNKASLSLHLFHQLTCMEYAVPYLSYKVANTISQGTLELISDFREIFTLRITIQMEVKFWGLLNSKCSPYIITKYRPVLKNLMSTFCENAVFNCQKNPSNPTPIVRFSSAYTMNFIEQAVTDTDEIFLRIYLSAFEGHFFIIFPTVLTSLVLCYIQTYLRATVEYLKVKECHGRNTGSSSWNITKYSQITYLFYT